INYYCREKYYRQLQTTCLESLRKYGNDSVLLFWKAFGILMEGNPSEAMREFESIKDKPEVVLCSTMALIYAHKKAKLVDREAVQELESKLRQDRQSCGEMALYFGSMFLLHTGKVDKAREYVDRMIKMSQDTKEGLILRGWIDISCGREAFVKKSIKFFDDSLKNAKNLDALFGKARYLQLKNNFSGALDTVNQAVVAYPECIPALIEKMRLQLALQDWDQTLETAQRALAINRNCIEAQRMVILFMLCRDGSYTEASEKIVELIHALDRCEPKNPHVYCNISQGFSRLCGRNSLVLQQTVTLIDRAQSLAPADAEYQIELGFQHVLQGKIRDATKAFRAAMKLDETSVPALTGIIRCQLIEGQLEDAEQQLEFLNEIQQSIGKSAELSYLTSVLYRKKGKPQEEVITALNMAIDTHFVSLKGLPLGTQYFVQMNPDFLIQVVKDYLMYAPSEPQSPGQPSPPLLKRCAAVLDPLTKAIPGLLEGLYLMGRVKYLAGNIVDVANAMLAHCLEQDATFSDAHLLMAQIQLQKNNFKQAEQSLEVGLSYNFEVREHPLYHLIKARVQMKMGNAEDSIKTLNAAMNLPGVRKQDTTGKRTRKINITASDRVSVYLELVQAHRHAGHEHEAAKIMQDALNEFQATPEEVRYVLIANVDLALDRGDTEQALSILRAITPEQAYYIKAKEKMAEIYLQHRKDKRLYASVYRELVDKNPSPHTCLLLGDAYMSIQEPEKAIEVYESALKKNPRDGSLASKIGQAYVKTHHYGKAINYYEAALKSGQQNFLRYDLAELYLRLRNYDKSEKVIITALEQEKASDLMSLINEAKLLMLLARVHQNHNNTEQTMNTLTKAKEVQTRILRRVTTEQPDAALAQKQLAAKICSEMAEISTASREYDKAINFYKEALVYDDTHIQSLLALAKLYLTVDDLDACQQQCVQLLKADPDNDAATVMMADLMFRKNEYDSATYHFQQLLERKPGHYTALARLIDLLRRAGKLEECPKYLEQAENALPRAAMDAGFNYCKGLYDWYTLNPTGALKHFNIARKDNHWGEHAVYNMVEICLNPDNETLGGETFEAVEIDSSPAQKQDSEMMAVRTAEKLLKEMRPKLNPLKHRILENSVLMATKAKPNVERALAQFMEIATTERDYVPALLGMATAYMYLKQTPRARNQLKRIAKMNWTFEESEEFERSWLLLADIYIQSGKYDMSGDLLKKCLQYNKSCCKAWEYMGFVMEKEQAYKDAAQNYENAWKNGNRNNPTIGFRLAFNYLKAKRFVDAIDVCHKVLSQHPNYPKIKKDILDKARSSLRV
ncbi:predicted protein, partial [Nematostella vectensis]